MTDRSCSVVDSIDCESPDRGGDASKLTACFCCGDDVCRGCSSVVLYRWKGQRRRVRACFRCQDERKIGRASPPDATKKP